MIKHYKSFKKIISIVTLELYWKSKFVGHIAFKCISYEDESVYKIINMTALRTKKIFFL